MNFELPNGMQTFPFTAELQVLETAAADNDGAPLGIVKAMVATLEAEDAYGRIVHQGAVGAQNVLLSDWGHSSVWGTAPVGKGRVWEDGVQLMAEFQYDMDREAGVDAFRMVQSLGGIAQWSIAYDPTDIEEGRNGALHFYALDMIESSPVGRGASPGTHTIQLQQRNKTAGPALFVAAAAMEIELAKRQGDFAP